MNYQKNKNQLLLLNILFFTLPISFILGNLVLNLNISLLIIFTFLIFRSKIFELKLNIIDKTVIIFFVYILLNGIYNNFFNLNVSNLNNENIVLIKSISFLRFLLFYFVIKFLVFKNHINYKFLFLIYGSICLFICVDVVIQFSLGKDIFGFESMGRRNPGPFNDEPIAGTFIQRFFIYALFFVVIFLNRKKNINKIILFSVVILCITGAIVAGNRMPLVIILLTLLILVVFEKSLRKILSFQLVLGVIFFSFLMKNPTEIRHHYKNFLADSKDIIIYSKSKILSEDVEISNMHLREFESGIFTWKENKILGGGVKSFRWVCNNIERSKVLHLVTKKGRVNCNNHPHNYYIQIAAELGVVGIIIFFILIFFTFVKSLKSLIFYQNDVVSKKLLFVFLILFINEVFPFKTTGSFFTTTNAYYIFFVLPFVSGLIGLEKKTNE